VYKKISKKELPIEGISPDFYLAKWRGKKKFDLLVTYFPRIGNTSFFEFNIR
jgi:hypothetical protein